MAKSIRLIDLAKDFESQGIVGVRKKVEKEDFLPIQYIPLKNLKIDPKYQRLINRVFIKKAKEFDSLLVKPLSVFLRPNGELMIADGQHSGVLAAIYCEDPENFAVPCQVQEHPEHFTDEECVEAEVSYFKRFNYLRNNPSAVAKLRADIAQGAEYALTLQDQFSTLGIHVEGIGSNDNGYNGVRGYTQLRVAIQKYGMTYVVQAVNTYKKHISNKLWNKPLNGAMILGLTGAYHFKDTQLGEGDKSACFGEYLSDKLGLTTVNDFINRTAGNMQDVLIVGRFVQEYNSCIKYKQIGNKYLTIGADKDNSLWKSWVDDEIHRRKKGQVSIDDEEE